MIKLKFESYDFKIKLIEEKQHIFDFIRKKYILLSPEEWVRQNLLHYMVKHLCYPKGMIAIEKKIIVNKLIKRYDIIIFDQNRSPWMLIECKKSDYNLSDSTLQQLLSYHSAIPCKYWMITNGKETFCAQAKDGKVIWLSSLPLYPSIIDE